MDTRGVRGTEGERDRAGIGVVPAVVTTILTRGTGGVPGPFGITLNAALLGAFVPPGVAPLAARTGDEITGESR